MSEGKVLRGGGSLCCRLKQIQDSILGYEIKEKSKSYEGSWQIRLSLPLFVPHSFTSGMYCRTYGRDAFLSMENAVTENFCLPPPPKSGKGILLMKPTTPKTKTPTPPFRRFSSSCSYFHGASCKFLSIWEQGWTKDVSSTEDNLAL